MKRHERIAILATAVLIAIVAFSGLRVQLKRESAIRREYKALIVPASRSIYEKGLFCGFHYHLLKSFAAATDTKITIDIGTPEMADSADVVIFRKGNQVEVDSLSRYLHVYDDGIWALKQGRKEFNKKISSWLRSSGQEEEFDAVAESFMKRYYPHLKRGEGHLCPYDSLLKRYADTLGTDWRLLAAIVYKESRFRIEARSHRGAAGLMQILPKTGSRLGVEDFIDPEKNLSAGVRQLKSLKKSVSRFSSNRDETIKITLAAYNAGLGHIQDCKTLAVERDLDPGVWDNLAGMIPLMRSDSILVNPSILCGTFQGYETLSYVESVMELFEKFRVTCPDDN